MCHTITHLRHIHGIVRAMHDSVVHVDRAIHDVDVMENVFRGVQLLSDSTKRFSGDVVDLDVRAWLAGTAISAVQISVLKNDDR
jgi:hypothetical protein